MTRGAVRRLALASTAVVVAMSGAVRGTGAAPTNPAPEPVRATSTPLFSARRVPGLVQSVAAERGLASSLLGVVARSPSQSCLTVEVSGRTLFASNPELPLIPASNQKVVTAVLVLDVLGAEHRFETNVAATLRTGGVVDGNLYLVGGGDPVLRTNAYQRYLGAGAGRSTSLEALADAVVAKGVKHVTGSVIGDESRYDGQRGVAGWPARYLDQHQLGPLSALDVDQGFTSFPSTYSETDLGPLVPATNPPEFAAETFAALLRARGVRIDGAAAAGTLPGSVPVVASVTSPPLRSIIAEMLDRSDNQIAELLVKEVGYMRAHQGTTAAGLAVLEQVFARLGLPGAGVVMKDGSGLSHDNRLTCHLVVGVLDATGADSPIAAGLAVGGETGTLRNRFTDDAVKGRIRAKTGTLNDVTALSGFADSQGGTPVVFSYLANTVTATPAMLAVQEDLGRALVAYGATTPLKELGPR
ncbi:MAG: D-alanyl-D-alanine carboxypeptidase/D-alanyl-D-alanine-endopeptidase [Actinobacteria bacterium]|nr:D-alanyl-D-alanine carboxypeptidase/D-alanyl-D-alanine-endopeptidase [Actinomycetota bacterium]